MLVDDVKVLNTKDLEWSKQNLPITMSPESANAEEKESNELAIGPSKKKMVCAKDVSIAVNLTLTYIFVKRLLCLTRVMY